MSNTSLRLTDDWKERVQAVAATRGMTTHAFLVESIQDATARAEQRARFIQDAEEARRAVIAGGDTFNAEDVHGYIKARSRGERKPRPEPTPWLD